MKENSLAEQLTQTALLQLSTSYQFKIPRINQIRKYRDLYNGKTQRQLRIRYNVPIPVFAGMIDTLQADLEDTAVLKAAETDPADWKAVQKFNAAIEKESTSMRPGAKWNDKFRMARQECVFTGRGILKYIASNEGGYTSNLDNVVFEDFFFEPKGGGHLENHLFCGQTNIWRTAEDLRQGARDGTYDARQVKKLLGEGEGNEYKVSSFWENYDFANRFQSMNLVAETHNYVGEPVYNLVEWGLTYKGQRWYILFEAFSGIWVRFEKLPDVFSNGYWPWMSFASHKDEKNFASKGFADDLYPVAVAMSDLFNEDLENKKRRNSNARAYDKDMFPNVAQLDEAQMGRDRLVSVDTKGGTRRIAEGIYSFETPEIKGTIDTLNYLETMTGRNLGVNDMQKGDSQPASKKVGVAYAELAQVSKRLSFESQPFIEMSQELALRVFGGLKDYLREPLSIRILGENGYEWDTLKRIELNLKKDFEITVSSQSRQNEMNEKAKETKSAALDKVAARQILNPNVNYRMLDEYELRNAGFEEAEIALMLDPNSQADKRTIAETSAAIQDLMMGRMPPTNYNATAYFLQRVLDFVKTHQDDKKIAKNFDKFMQYIQAHQQIAADNEARRAQKDVQTMNRGAMLTPPSQGQPGQTPGPMPPQPAPVAAGTPPMQ